MTKENIFTMDTSVIKFGNGFMEDVGKKEFGSYSKDPLSFGKT